MARQAFWRSIRFKLLLVSFTLLGIPWAGYRFIQETEHFLRDAQDQALRTTASSVANIMHEHDDAFHGVARPGSVLTFRNLYLHPLDKAPQVDGYRDEWGQYSRNFSLLQSIDDSLQARVFTGHHGRYLYLFIGVRDPTPDFGSSGDAIDLAVIDRKGELQQYRIQAETPGWVIARKRLSGDEVPDTPVYEPAIRGEWQPHSDGHTLELRLPRDLVSDRLSLRLFDSASRQVLASARLFPAESIGRLVEPSDALNKVLASVTPPATRVWVTDHQGLVLAKGGRLDADAPLSADEHHMPWFIRDLILAVLPRDADAVVALDSEQTHLFMSPVLEALSGQARNLRRLPPQGKAVIVSAAVPIRSSRGIRGAVLVEQTTNAILSIQNLALQRLFGVTLLFFAVTSLGLLAFATLLASRITRLRNRVESAVSHDGRIVGSLPPDKASDEIGDLGRSFSNVLARLHEYNHYLEAMASRLAHELRTPLAVVRSSLDNADQVDGDAMRSYIERARFGTRRLEHILASLREATGLEQAMRQAEPVSFDLSDLLRLQTRALADSYPAVRIELHCRTSPLIVGGVPELISQAVDKLIGNAIDFHRPDSTIVVECGVDPGGIRIEVRNLGPTLPPDTDVFQSMVTVRDGRSPEPHLGLGLYLVRLIAEFHRGTAEACDLPEGDGVMVAILLPAHAAAAG